MGFWEDLGDGLSYAFPVVAAANGLGELGDMYWGQFGMSGPGNDILGGEMPFGLGGGKGGEGTAAGLSPQQQLAAMSAAQNPSTQNQVVGYTEERVIPGHGVKPDRVIPAQPIYGPSVHAQAYQGMQAGPRDAPQADGARLQRGAVQNVQGAQIDPAGMNTGLGMTRAGFNTADRGLQTSRNAVADANQTRGVQDAQTARLTGAADGTAPSVAENQLRSGLQQGLQNNLAMAASSRGSGSGAVLAQRQAMDNNAALGARTNAQAAQLRAGEMAQARQDLTGHLGQVRGQDLATGALGTQMAGVGVQQAGIGAQVAGIGAQQATAQAGLNQQANLANQQMDLAVGQANLSNAQATQLANLNAQMQQQGLDDQQRAMYLGAILGIDARTQQGQMQLQQMLTNATLTTQATNAGIGLGMAQNATNQQNGMISGAATLGAALI